MSGTPDVWHVRPCPHVHGCAMLPPHGPPCGEMQAGFPSPPKPAAPTVPAAPPDDDVPPLPPVAVLPALPPLPPVALPPLPAPPSCVPDDDELLLHAAASRIVAPSASSRTGRSRVISSSSRSRSVDARATGVALPVFRAGPAPACVVWFPFLRTARPRAPASGNESAPGLAGHFCRVFSADRVRADEGPAGSVIRPILRVR